MPVQGHMSDVHFGMHTVFTAWQWGPFPLLAVACLLGLAYWYLGAVWKLAARGRRWPGLRTVAFLGGLVAIDLALQSPVATFTASYFEAHVLQHLLLMVVAPPLLALSGPSTLLLQSSNRRTKTRWLAVLRSRPFAVLTHPLTAWTLYFGAMTVFFLSSLINVAMDHMALMDAINLVFLLGGCLYWWPLIGIDPIVHWKMGYGARMASILLGGPIEVWLGIAIMSSRRPIASMYTLAGTHTGGAILWTATEFATFAGFVPIFVLWSRSEQRKGTRADARGARGARGAVRDVPESAGTDRGNDRRGSPTEGGTPVSAWEAAWLARTGGMPLESPASRVPADGSAPQPTP